MPFEKFGDIKGDIICKGKYAFITFMDTKAAQDAVSGMNNI